jgi:hypothetical protein
MFSRQDSCPRKPFGRFPGWIRLSFVVALLLGELLLSQTKIAMAHPLDCSDRYYLEYVPGEMEMSRSSRSRAHNEVRLGPVEFKGPPPQPLPLLTSPLSGGEGGVVIVPEDEGGAAQNKIAFDESAFDDTALDDTPLDSVSGHLHRNTPGRP